MIMKMNRYVLFLSVEKLDDKDVFDEIIQSFVKNDIEHVGNASDSDKLFSKVHTACIHPYASNETEAHAYVKKVSWSFIKTAVDGDVFLNSITSQTVFNKSLLGSFEHSLHTLAEELPPLGVVTDVVLFVQNIATFSCDLSIYGALKRFHHWHNAMITVLHCSNNVQNAAPELSSWMSSLQAHLLHVSDKKSLSFWHGSILVAGSQQTMKLPGFHLNHFPSDGMNKNYENNFGIDKEQSNSESDIFLSTSLMFVTEVNLNEVPTFYMTRNCYQLAIMSQTDKVECSRQFLNRLVTNENKCYIMRLCYGTNWKRIRRATEQKQRFETWHELIKENIAHASDSPFLAELDGKLECVHFLARSVKLRDISDDSEHNIAANNIFLAIRLRNVAEFDGKVAHMLATNVVASAISNDSVTNSCLSVRPEACLQSLCSLSVKELAHCLTNSAPTPTSQAKTCPDGSAITKVLKMSIVDNIEQFNCPSLSSAHKKFNFIFHRPQSECMEKLCWQPERQMLCINTRSDSVDDGLHLAKDTLSKLSPPSKRKVIVLTAGEIIKFFNSDGTAAQDCRMPVAMKKPSQRLFHYTSVDEDGECFLAKWPDCLRSHFHDVYYNVCNAELVAKKCNRQISGETSSTCSIYQQNISILNPQHILFPTTTSQLSKCMVDNLLSQKGVSSKNRTTRAHHVLSKEESRQSRVKLSPSKRTPVECSSENSRLAERKKRKKTVEMESQQDTSEQRPIMRRTESMAAIALREPRSLRNRRKMEEVITETLIAQDILQSNSLFKPCFKRLCTVTETFVKDLPTSRGLREEMQKIAEQYAAHIIAFEKNCQQRIASAIKR